MRYQIVETPPNNFERLISNDTCRLCCCADHNNGNKCNEKKRTKLNAMLGDCTEDGPLQHYEEINPILSNKIRIL